ncbi:hypothetical protein PENANT_c015G06281 [Penicillium antarcticum]|uniref:Indole-diterpene biosynthesis protein PaxU n=1 Tax=Penicillium antarcticum TaxID=416450 RepID=A0A1V6Q4Q3_9EURO|nr:uncharacterized protein N7508_004973 [Penicillium antarcticum]KAJ5305958.1 hypothetical protein N7508_004973 [Penicillium antarcticum]OQD83862.1 hypothetical protein PENANT_c015G06281 [Penicillium antarcticum]
MVTIDPLAPFARLAPSVYIQDPETNQATRPIILIAFWMNAPPRALAKYVAEYRRMVPTARIIFVRSSSNDFMFRSSQSQRARMAPAVEAMRTFVAPENPVYMHMFSNGGLSNITGLLQAWNDIMGTSLPISSMILDSAPGKSTLRSGLKAFSYALPRMWILRLLGKAMLFALLVFFKLVHVFSVSLDPISLARKVINDTSLMQAANPEKALTRCYIYSDTDELVDWRDTESHAVEAEAHGWVVRRELFKGSAHVAHMKVDPDRYWGIVKEHLGPLISG